MKSYDEELKKVQEELEKRGLSSSQSADTTGIYNLEKLWRRVWDHDSAKAARWSLPLSIAAIILSIIAIGVECFDKFNK